MSFLPCESLVGDKPGQRWSHLLGEANDARPGIGDGLCPDDWSHDADESAIRAVVTDSVGDHVCMSDVFVGDTATMGLIPVKDKLSIGAVTDDVFSDLKLPAVVGDEIAVAVRLKYVAGAWKAVLR